MMGSVWVGRLFGRRPPPVSVAWYGPSGDTPEGRLAGLLVTCTDASASVRLVAERSLRAELDALLPSRWRRLDEQLRSWLHMQDEAQQELPVAPDSAALPLFACFHSGFVRERAVQGLAGWGDGRELPALLIRANDWVPQVRAKATEALLARLTPQYVRHWVWNLGLVARMRRAGRGDHRPLVDGVLALLATPDARPALQDGLYSLDDDGRWLLASILFGSISSGDHDIVLEGLHSTDTLIRVAAAGAAERLDDEGVRRVLPNLLTDRLRRVRAIGIRLAADRVGTAQMEAYRTALLDKSPAVRDAARRAIEALEPMDFAEFYRGRMQNDHPALPHVIDGIRQTGSGVDAAVVRGFVDHPRPRVRAAALRALDRFAAEGVEDFLLLAIADPNRGVSTTAAKLLLPRVAKVAPGELAALFSADLPTWARRNVLSLLALRGKWVGLPWLIRATNDVDDRVAAHADVLLRRWRDRFNRSFTQPTPEQRADALAALEQCGHAIVDNWRWSMPHPHLREWLSYILETSG